MTIPDWAWIAWLTLTVVLFAALETLALVNRRRGDTLSEALRRWLGIMPTRPWGRAGAAVFAATIFTAAAWLVPHIVN